MNKQVLTWTLAAAMAASAAQSPDAAALALESARKKETVSGDLEAAIHGYKDVVAKYGNRPAIVARALVSLGQCYEKLGSTEARKAYQRVVKEFGGEAVAATARARLSAMGGPNTEGVVVQIVAPPKDSSLARARVTEVSRDGRYLIYSSGRPGGWGMTIRDLRTEETRLFLKGGGNRMRWPVRVSPDGSHVAFISQVVDPVYLAPSSELHVARTDGSGVKVFTEKDLGGLPQVPSLWNWTGDGKRVALLVRTQDGSKLAVVNVVDGKATLVASAAGFTGAISTGQISPDGKYVAMTKRGKTGFFGDEMVLIPVDGSAEIPVVRNGQFPMWSADGSELLFQSNRRGVTDLYAVAVQNGKVAAPELVRENLDGFLIGMTAAGELYYSAGSHTKDLYTVEFDEQTGRPKGRPVKVTDRYINSGPAWSPDGKTLAYVSVQDGKELGSGQPPKLMLRTGSVDRVLEPSTVLEVNYMSPQWFPDGRSLLIQPPHGAEAGRLAKVDVQSGAVTMLFGGERLGFQSRGSYYTATPQLTPDGKAVILGLFDGEKARVTRRELDTGAERLLGTVAVKSGLYVAVSPDGRRLAFFASLQGRAEPPTLLTMDANGGDPVAVKMPPIWPASSVVAWSRSGKRIFFAGMEKPALKPGPGARSDIWSVAVDGGEAVPMGIRAPSIGSLAMHPDGGSLVYFDETERRDLWVVRNVLKGLR